MCLGTNTLISRRRLASRDSPARAVPRALAAEAAGRRSAAAGFFFVACDFFAVGFFTLFFAFPFPVFPDASTAGLSCSSHCKACNVLATASSPEGLRSIWTILSAAGSKETSAFLSSKAKAGAETFRSSVLSLEKNSSQAKTRQSEIGLSLDQRRNDPSGSSDRHPHRKATQVPGAAASLGQSDACCASANPWRGPASPRREQCNPLAPHRRIPVASLPMGIPSDHVAN